MEYKNTIKITLAVAFTLLIPFIAMQFTDQVNWSLTDFVIAGILLFSAGFVYQLFARKINTTIYRVAVGIVIAAVLVLVWVELAVGIFGTPWSGS